MYDYIKTEAIGASSGTHMVGDPILVMTAMKMKFKEVFPFEITGCSEPLSDGAMCKLHPSHINDYPPSWIIGCGLNSCGDVQVFFVDSTTFGFRVVANGYFDAPNSWITFLIFIAASTANHTATIGTNPTHTIAKL